MWVRIISMLFVKSFQKKSRNIFTNISSFRIFLSYSGPVAVLILCLRAVQGPFPLSYRGPAVYLTSSLGSAISSKIKLRFARRWLLSGKLSSGFNRLIFLLLPEFCTVLNWYRTPIKTRVCLSTKVNVQFSPTTESQHLDARNMLRTLMFVMSSCELILYSSGIDTVLSRLPIPFVGSCLRENFITVSPGTHSMVVLAVTYGFEVLWGYRYTGRQVWARQ